MPDSAAAGPTETPAAVTLPPLPGRDKAAFSLGDLPDSIAVTAANTFLLFYLTAVCGLPGALAGAALAIAQVADAFSDPLIGFFTDNARTRLGRRHPFMLAAVWPLGLSLGLLFSAPHLAPGWGLFAYVTAALLVVRVSHSAFTLPYAALGAELANDYAERSVMTTYRWTLNITGNAICIVLGLAVFMRGKDGLLDRAAYSGFGWACAAVVVAGGLASALSTLRLRKRLRAPAEEDGASLLGLPAEVAAVFRNPSFRILFATALVFFSTQGMAVALGLHANRYFWKLSSDVIQAILIANLAGLGLGLPVAGLLLRRFEKHRIAAAGIGAIALCQMTPPVLKLLGLTPPEGHTALYLLLGAFGVLSGCAMTCVVIPFWSMMADAADEHQFLFGARREALYFAGLTLSAKAATGLGGLVAGLALDGIGFPHDPAVLAKGLIAPETLRNLGLIYGPGGALGIAVGGAVLTRYALDRLRHEEIQAAIAARRTI